MKKKILKTLILLLALSFFLTSCGIPNWLYVASSDVTFNSTSTELRIDDEIVEKASGGYPKVYFYYQLVPNNLYSGFNNAISKFNSRYCSTPDGNMIPSYDSSSPAFNYQYSIKFDDDETKTDSYKICAFQIVNESTGYSSISQSLGLNSTNILSSSTGDYYYWYVNIVGIDNGYMLIQLAPDSEPIKVRRYNGESFTLNLSDYYGDEIPSTFSNSSKTTSITSYSFVVYAVVSLEFEDYNNIFNSTMKTVSTNNASNFTISN